MKWMGRTPKAPEDLLRALSLPRREKVLAFAAEEQTGSVVVATTAELFLVHDNAVQWRRPWLDVDSGQWDPDTWTLSVTWVDRGRPAQFVIRTDDTRLPEVFHERVQASVVLSAPLPLAQHQGTGRVAIRKDLRSGRLHEQRIFGRRTDSTDPQVQQAADRALAQLRDQVGL